jgi:hypothetical protein
MKEVRLIMKIMIDLNILKHMKVNQTNTNNN